MEEYEKVLEEKRKALAALKTEERKVDLDKELKSMQQLSSKKTNDEIFIKLVITLPFILTVLYFMQDSLLTLQLIVRVLKRIKGRKLLRRRREPRR